MKVRNMSKQISLFLGLFDSFIFIFFRKQTTRPCFKSFFFSLREHQPLLLPELEEEKEQPHVLVCGKKTHKSEETEKPRVQHWNRLLGQ